MIDIALNLEAWARAIGAAHAEHAYTCGRSRKIDESLLEMAWTASFRDEPGFRCPPTLETLEALFVHYDAGYRVQWVECSQDDEARYMRARAMGRVA